MKIRKPVGPSDRCGVSNAEKIFGSRGACAPLLLSPFIMPIIRKSSAHGRPLPRLKATTRSASRPNRRAFRPGHRNHNGQMLAFVYFEDEPVGGEATNAGRGAADCDQRGEAAGVAWGL